MQFADLLLAYGRTSHESRVRAFAGLKSLSTIKDIAPQSRSVLQRNLGLLALSEVQLEDQQSQKVFFDIFKEIVEFRDYTDKMYGLVNA